MVFWLLPSPQTYSDPLLPKSNPTRARDETFLKSHFSRSDSPGRLGKSVFFPCRSFCIHPGVHLQMQDVPLMLRVTWDVLGRRRLLQPLCKHMQTWGCLASCASKCFHTQNVITPFSWDKLRAWWLEHLCGKLQISPRHKGSQTLDTPICFPCRCLE